MDIKALLPKIGSLLYIFIFTEDDQVMETGILDLALSDLFTNFETLKAKIKEHCITVSKMPSDIAPKTSVLSLFIIDSVLDDLIDLINNKSDWIVVVNDQIVTLHEELMLLGSSITDIALQHEVEHEELVTRSKDIVYEVEFEINSFPHVWYLILRLPQLIDKIRLIVMAIKEMKNNIEVVRMSNVSKHPHEHVEPQSKEPSILEDIVVGFDNVVIEITEQLVGGTGQLQIICIFGMSGLGKTTLENKLYKHLSILYHFYKRAYKRDTYMKKEEEILVQDLYKNLKRRRFLIVIDDIGISKLSVGKYYKGVFKDRKCPQELLDTGKLIVKNYQGLPLAVVVIAGVLANMENYKVFRVFCGWSLYDFLIGLEYLVHLRYLEISCTLPQMENFHILEFRVVYNDDEIELPEILLNMVSLRHMEFKGGAYFIESSRQLATNNKSFQINNLQSIFVLSIYDEMDESILRSSPNLCRVEGRVENSLNCSFNFLNQLESLKLSTAHGTLYWRSSLISWPLNLKKLTLVGVYLSRKQMEIIGRLRCLEVLKLVSAAFEWEQWDTSESEFPQLKYLKLCAVKIAEWNASSDNFPRLQRIVLEHCKNLKMIPSNLGDIPTLQKIELFMCGQTANESAKKIEEEQKEMGNENFEVTICSTFGDIEAILSHISPQMMKEFNSREIQKMSILDD
ncbi:putative late blight resistance protein homolog R1B-17 [Olea europaea var. sylvestris]|uniref:putative late blight resistance protein homolog R1B-17 n=1 Tax=Olea europaea var. sylvestris TaxID=158386 RepID=UPI000C1D8CC2|nr:putative late blight resistance protein homolog R1B-17 [Olea europaea var. sylvestris]